MPPAPTAFMTSPGEQGSQPEQGHDSACVSWGAGEGHSWQSVTYHWGPCAICLLHLLCWCLTVAHAPVESSSWGWMLNLIGEEGEVGLQEGCCLAQRRSQLSDCEGPFLGRSLKASIGQLTSALPSLQSHRVKGKSKWLLPLSWCPVSL